MDGINDREERFDDDDVADEMQVSGREIVAGFAVLDPALLPPLGRPWSGRM